MLLRPLGKQAHILQSILIYFVAAINIIPIGGQIAFANYFWLLPMIGWFILILFFRPAFFSHLPSPLYAMALFVLYTVTVPYMFDNYSIGNRFLSLAQIPFFYFAFSFNFITGRNKTNLSIAKWTIPLILYTAINTFTGLLSNPYLARQAVNIRKDSQDGEFLAFGGYDFIYFLAISSAILFGILFFFKSCQIKKLNRYIILSLLGFFILIILMANFFTAAIMLLASFSVFLLLKKITTFKILLILSFVLLFSFGRIQLLSNVVEIAEYITPNGPTVNRLKALQLAEELNLSANITESRQSTLLISIHGFLQNPFFGKIATNFSLSEGYYSGFGQHSQILDSLSLFGVVGFLQIYFILMVFLKRIKRKDNNLNAFTFSILISVFIVNFFNNTTALIGFAYFFLYPTIYCWITENQLKKIN